MENTTPSISKMISLSISATNSLFEFMSKDICPIFKNDQDQTHFQAAIMTTFNRMILWLSDLAIIKEPIHIQLVATCARSLFENLIDLKYLIANPSEAEKFSAFTYIRRFDIADKISNACLAHPKMDIGLFATEIKLCNNEKIRSKREKLCHKYNYISKNGSIRKPMHWWGTSLEERTNTIDPDGSKDYKNYLRIYGTTSNLIHPGGVGLNGISGKGVASLFIGLSGISQEFCLDATEIICSNFSVPEDTIEKFHKQFFGDAPYC